MQDNLWIYNNVREVPKNAQKPIHGGRLKGKTDINPMWRLKTLTELFGPCGIGWKYEIVNMRLEPAPNGEIAAFVDINLYIKIDGEWSEPIPGTGGNMFVANEKGGLYVSDECFKMALTDAISVSCKALGVGADIYWDSDGTKYDTREQPQSKPTKQDPKTEKEIGRAQIMQVVINTAEEKGMKLSMLNKGVAKYFPGKTNIANLSEDELRILLGKINAMESDSNAS